MIMSDILYYISSISIVKFGKSRTAKDLFFKRIDFSTGQIFRGYFLTYIILIRLSQMTCHIHAYQYSLFSFQNLIQFEFEIIVYFDDDKRVFKNELTFCHPLTTCNNQE